MPNTVSRLVLLHEVKLVQFGSDCPCNTLRSYRRVSLDSKTARLPHTVKGELVPDFAILLAQSLDKLDFHDYSVRFEAKSLEMEWWLSYFHNLLVVLNR